MAKGDKIQQVNPATVEVAGEEMEIAASAVTSVTTEVPSEADASSAPGPYTNKDGTPLDVNRPPVSTNRPDVPIAHSLVAGAGAPTGPPEYQPEAPPSPEDGPATAYVSSADKENVVELAADKQGNVTLKDENA